MLAEESLRIVGTQGSVALGDELFAKNRVQEIQEVAGVIGALVQDGRLYTVELIVQRDDLMVHCECSWFQQHRRDCKHIWAAIRAASVYEMLPERELGIDIIGAPLVFERPPAWQRFLDAIGSHSVRPRRAAAAVPDEIAYVIHAPAGFSPAVTLRISSRTRKKDGQWGKWKPLSLDADELPLLPEFDRDTIALLADRYWKPAVESVVKLPARTTAWWIERLARAGKLFVSNGAGELRPIGWDEGPPWTFDVSVVNDPDASAYRVVGAIRRGAETLSFDDVDGIYPGIVLSGGRVSRFDDGGRISWMQALLANSPVVVPHAEADRFRRALLRTPLTNLALPEELGWDVVDVRPTPLLALEHQSWGSELHADLSFLYDDWRVSSRSTEAQTTIGRKLLRRDVAAETAAGARLAAAGAIGTYNGYRVRPAQLEPLVRALAAEGWRIEIDKALVFASDELELELSSGIDWFDLHVSASFGDTRVGLPELLAAAEGNRSLLRLPDGSYGLIPAAWLDSLAPVLELGKREGSGLRFPSVQALLIDALLQSKRRTADDAFADLRQRLVDAAPEPRPEPPTFGAALRPYQREGLGWLHFLRASGLGGCLADDMGLGKTVQTLALLEELRASGNAGPSLVVAPRSLLFNWAAEAKRFAPELRVLEHHGPERGAGGFGEYDLVLTTYATMRLDVTRLAGTEFEYVILDEAQAIKNASSQVAKASRLLHGRHRLALSGTPVENHLGELWSLFEFLNPGLLGPARTFSRTFAAKGTPPERRDALARALRPLILRRTKEQVAPELPERTEQTLYCEMDPKQRRQYDDLREHYRQALLGEVRTSGIEKSRMQILEALLRLRQAACHPALVAGGDAEEWPSAKSELLMEELREVLDSGHRALVFSQFTSFLRLVANDLDKERVPYLYLDGRTRDRQSLVRTFQGDDGPPLFLISLKAGGLGLNLTNADYIFLLDPWWNPAVEAQAIDRAHRIGQRNPVVAYRLIARDTVEEKILELQSRKRELAESILSEDNSVLRKLELEDLELLLS